MDKHYSICVGRKFGSGGLEIATMAADRLGVKVYDKALLETASKKTGFGREFFDKADEEKTRRGLRSFFMSHLTEYGLSRNYLTSESLFKMQSETIKSIYEQEDCLFVGRCADYVLRDSSRLFSVFIAADMDDRIERICKKEGGISPEKARSIIREHDRKRASYYNYFTGRVWGDPDFYDICLNSSVLGYEKCVNLITALAKERLDIK